jgi:hypothetical protein
MAHALNIAPHVPFAHHAETWLACLMSAVGARGFALDLGGGRITPLVVWASLIGPSPTARQEAVSVAVAFLRNVHEGEAPVYDISGSTSAGILSSLGPTFDDTYQVTPGLCYAYDIISVFAQKDSPAGLLKSLTLGETIRRLGTATARKRNEPPPGIRNPRLSGVLTGEPTTLAPQHGRQLVGSGLVSTIHWVYADKPWRAVGHAPPPADHFEGAAGEYDAWLLGLGLLDCNTVTYADDGVRAEHDRLAQQTMATLLEGRQTLPGWAEIVQAVVRRTYARSALFALMGLEGSIRLAEVLLAANGPLAGAAAAAHGVFRGFDPTAQRLDAAERLLAKAGSKGIRRADFMRAMCVDTEALENLERTLAELGTLVHLGTDRFQHAQFSTPEIVHE